MPASLPPDSAGPADPDRIVALNAVPVARRGALAALFALDERLGGIVARTREPTIGLMRLVWWRDALAALDDAPPPAEPLLAALAVCGAPGAALAAMTAGWEALLDDPEIGDDTLDRHAHERGARLFMLAGDLLGAAADDAPRLARAGEGWALADLARHLDRPARAAAVRAAARAPLGAALATRWPRALRPLGQLAALALGDVGRAAPTGPRRRVLRALRHQLTGH